MNTACNSLIWRLCAYLPILRPRPTGKQRASSFSQAFWPTSIRYLTDQSQTPTSSRHQPRGADHLRRIVCAKAQVEPRHTSPYTPNCRFAAKAQPTNKMSAENRLVRALKLKQAHRRCHSREFHDAATPAAALEPQRRELKRL